MKEKTDIYIFYFELKNVEKKIDIDKKTSSLARKLLIEIVKKKFLINEQDLMFAKSKNGKPYFENHPDIFFNISHSYNKVICAIGDSSIGIDIEEVKNPNLKLAQRFFVSKEIKYIFFSKLIKFKNLRFYKIWTRKEAYVKNTGEGLSKSFKTFCVLNEFNKYRFKTFIKGNSVISICYIGEAKIHLNQIDSFEFI
ncbi:MAG: 4'-phosphopantetheinyl transferase family protein [Sarcina sp.]